MIKVVFLNKLFDSERACREWAKCCVSRSIQIDLLVAHHAQIFKGVRVRKHYTVKVQRGQVFRVGDEAHYL
jgi:hypothetical protein